MLTAAADMTSGTNTILIMSEINNNIYNVNNDNNDSTNRSSPSKSNTNRGGGRINRNSRVIIGENKQHNIN